MFIEELISAVSNNDEINYTSQQIKWLIRQCAILRAGKPGNNAENANDKKQKSKTESFQVVSRMFHDEYCLL